MDWRFILFFAIFLLLLWLGPYAWIIFEKNISKPPTDITASDRRLIRLCLRGLIAIAAALLLHWWLG